MSLARSSSSLSKSESHSNGLHVVSKRLSELYCHRRLLVLWRLVMLLLLWRLVMLSVLMCVTVIVLRFLPLFKSMFRFSYMACLLVSSSMSQKRSVALFFSSVTYRTKFSCLGSCTRL